MGLTHRSLRSIYASFVNESLGPQCLWVVIISQLMWCIIKTRSIPCSARDYLIYTSNMPAAVIHKTLCDGTDHMYGPENRWNIIFEDTATLMDTTDEDDEYEDSEFSTK